MKVVFCSNYLNHHQLRFCLKMRKLVDEFIFIAEKPMEKHRLQMGWEDANQYEFVHRAYESEEAFNKAIELTNEADVVIAGDSSQKFIQQRIEQNKIIFYADERILKTDNFYKKLKHRLRLNVAIRTRKRYHKSNAYLLAYSAFTKEDYKKCFGFKNPTFRLGYFPYIEQKPLNEIFAEKKSNGDAINILYAGRLIDWKRPDWAIKAVHKALEKFPRLQLSIVGNSDEQPEFARRLHDYITNNKLENNIKFLGSKSPEEVLRLMRASDIFLFPSNVCEGWGAVLNEAMASACAVIASDKIGAAPFLIKDGKNGLVFKNKSFKDLCSKLIALCADSELRKKLSGQAYYTMLNGWNADIAAERLVKIFENLLAGKVLDIYKEGLCSIQ